MNKKSPPPPPTQSPCGELGPFDKMRMESERRIWKPTMQQEEFVTKKPLKSQNPRTDTLQKKYQIHLNFLL